jgi:DNA-binding NtrC family response regulator
LGLGGGATAEPWEATRDWPAAELVAPESLADLEKQAIVAALEQTRGNKTRAAVRLGITRTQLHTRLKRFGIT